MRSSFACAVVAVAPELIVKFGFVVPVALAVLSSATTTSPFACAALTAFAVTLAPKVTVSVSVVARFFPLATFVEQMTVRTPLVPLPFTLSTSLLYVFNLLSEHVTDVPGAPPTGSIAMLMMTVSPAGTASRSGFMVIVVPDVSFAFDPRS